jgi:hypothetical protein
MMTYYALDCVSEILFLYFFCHMLLLVRCRTEEFLFVMRSRRKALHRRFRAMNKKKFQTFVQSELPGSTNLFPSHDSVQYELGKYSRLIILLNVFTACLEPNLH